MKDDNHKKEVAKFAKVDKNSKYKAYAKQVALTGRDNKEKELMKLKYDRMNSAMRNVVSNSNMEFM